MPESPPPGVAEDAAGGPAQALNPAAIAGALADFHNWLTALAVRPAAPPPPPPPAPPDLYSLLAQMTALRQEVNLQTRAVRAQQEQNSEALAQLAQAVEMLEEASGAPARNGESSDDPVRPLLKTLVDLYDALALAGREIGRLKDGILPQLEAAVVAVPAAPPEPEFPPPPRSQSWWRRWTATETEEKGWHREFEKYLAAWREREARIREAQAKQRADGIAQVRQALESLVSGYAMGLERIERGLRQHGLEAIRTEGRPFDPDEMEVIEAVPGTGVPAGEVLQEVRRGYRWNGRVFRYAQVRVARA